MSANDPLKSEDYFYDEQIRNYLIQAMAIFAELKVMIGASESREARTISVPVHYGDKDRVVAAIKADNTQNKPIRVPCTALHLSGLDMAPELRKGIGTTRRQPFLRSGGIFPDDIRVVHKFMPMPYKANLELSIFASSTDQHFQILEQLLSIFNPTIQLQSSDEVFDWTKITTMELTGVNFESAYPVGADRRIITSTINFVMPIYIGIPADVKDKFVASVMIRIGLMRNNDPNTILTTDDMIFDLDDQRAQVNKIFDVQDVDLNG